MKGGWQDFFFFILSPYYDRTATTPLKTIYNMIGGRRK